MKKTLMVAMALIVAMGTMFAQPKNMEAEYWKMAKKRAKMEAKDKWIMEGSKTMEMALFQHYQKINAEGCDEMTGSVIGSTSVKTVNQGAQWAATNAAISYAKQAGMMMRGRINAMSGAGVEDPSVDKFIEGYEALVQKEIQGEIKKSFGMYREKKNGGIDYKAYFIICEDAAQKARERAFEKSKQESKFALEQADEISKFVREGFKPVSE